MLFASTLLAQPVDASIDKSGDVIPHNDGQDDLGEVDQTPTEPIDSTPPAESAPESAPSDPLEDIGGYDDGSQADDEWQQAPEEFETD